MKNATRIVIVLDRSGSMETAREPTISGINKFVSEQKLLPGECTLKLVQFDEYLGKMDYHVVFDQIITEVPTLTQKDFDPRGGTPLLDAQGRTITELGDELSAIPEAIRPNKVLVVTITDGHENASTVYSADQIRKMIDHQKTKYNWDFVYIGANQDAVAVGATIGIMRGKSMSYNVNDPLAVASTFTNLSSYARRTRSGATGQSVQEEEFTEQERSSSMTGEK